MDEIEQNGLASRLLNLLRAWIDAIIPEETKNCIRSKAAIVIKVNSNDSYNVILSEDYNEYLDLVEMRRAEEITDEEFNQRVALISIDELFTIKNTTYNVNDCVIVGFLDNKLTNTFILCKNKNQN